MINRMQYPEPVLQNWCLNFNFMHVVYMNEQHILFLTRHNIMLFNVTK